MTLIETSSSGSETDRRRRRRVGGRTEGWILPDTPAPAEPWEVRVYDVSRDGVGFESSEPHPVGGILRIRIGRGPIALARRIRIVRCDQRAAGLHAIGGEFI